MSKTPRTVTTKNMAAVVRAHSNALPLLINRRTVVRKKGPSVTKK